MQAPRLLLRPWQSARQYSVKLEAASASKLRDIDPLKLHVTQTTKPGALQKPEDLVFGKTFTGKSALVL